MKRLKGRYKLGAVLGLGSLGATYRAEDVLLQRPVAVKMLADRYADDGAFRERFMAATAAAGRLMKAIERVTANPRFHTPDLGGKARTVEVTAAVIDAIGAENA